MCMLKLQQAAVPLQSALPAASVMSSQPVEKYMPPGDMYWARTGSDHSYHSSQSQSHRSVFLLRMCKSDMFADSVAFSESISLF